MASPRISAFHALPPLALGIALALAGCGKSEPDLPPEVRQTAVPERPGAVKMVDEKGVTALADRVATLGLLNKRNNLTRDIKLKPGQSLRIDNVIVKLAACEKTAPWEDPPETGAFVQVFVEERATVREKLAWRKVFSGWLFRNAPSLNVVEHPVYDVWVKDCAMRFPGDEANPKAAASASSAAKPAGKPSTAASPSSSPAPVAAPSPATAPA
jgi:hypothetical protein